MRWAEVRGAYAGRARRLCDGSVEAMVGRLRADWAGLYRSATVVHRWQVGATPLRPNATESNNATSAPSNCL